MCGIAGIFAYHYAANPVDREELIRIRERMAARGPDGKGSWFSDQGRVGLSHRRLSIIDLTDAGAQPMVSDDGKLVVIFNGEIYNYRDLRKGLEAQGRVFRSNSDTEVLLHLYAEKGEEMVHALRGMFAFAIWDADRKALFLARDPYGIKPLYYADDGWTFRFASQVKALMAGGGVSHDPESAGWVGFYLFGSVPEPFTLYRQVQALPAGTTLWVDRIGPHGPRRYHSIAAVYFQAESEPHKTDLAEDGETVRAALSDSVNQHLVADVPVGGFLSAGVDSGTLVGLMRDASQGDVQTVTLAFEEFRGTPHDEAPLAEQVAKLYGTRHTTRIVTEHEFQEDLPDILSAMDQPTIDGINTWFVSKAARELGLKVAISGLGGDELFGGYPSFKDVPRLVKCFQAPAKVPLLGSMARCLLAGFGTQRVGAHPKTAGLLEYGGSFAGAYLLRRGLFMPWELDQVLSPHTVREGLRRLKPIRMIEAMLQPGPREPFACVAALEASLYMRNQLLRDTDWASMAHGLEVRVPLVDHVLLSRLAQLPSRSLARAGKGLMAASPRTTLPAIITSRAKSGFTMPIAAWTQRQGRTNPSANIPTLGTPSEPWARRWACGVAAGMTT
jgi:asparagine synthase (glutamine-hydrolysing)